MNDSVKIWIGRAESSYKLGIIDKIEEIYYEDLCFQLQQACEKSLKALLIHKNIDPPKTHSFGILLQKIEEIMEIPSMIKDVIMLNNFAVQIRYPGDYVPVDKEEYLVIRGITEYVLNWVKKMISI